MSQQLFYYSAPWCKPCEMLNPVIKQAVEHLGDKIKLLEINIDEGSDIASKCEIMSVPTLILTYKNKEIRRSGYMGVKDIIDWIEEFTNSVT